MRRFVRWLAFALAFIVSGSAWAYMPASSKGVYYGGKIHYISVNEDQKVFHTDGTVQSGETWEGPWEKSATASIGLTSGWKRQDPQKYGVGEATVVVGAVIVHYAALIDPSGARWLCVSRFDANTNTFLPAQEGATGDVHPAPIVKMTGSDTNHYAVAATVFGDRIYVFSSEFTLFSTDSGRTHSQLPVIASGLSRHNARDAITFFPEDGAQKMLVAFSDRHNDYGSGWMGFVIWDGVATLPLPSTSVRRVTYDFIGTVVLMLGTSAGRHDTFAAGAKEPCIQMVASNPFLNRVHLFEYRIRSNVVAHTGTDYYNGEIRRLRVFPWFETETDPLGRPVMKQFIGINFYHCVSTLCAIHAWERYALKSDFMLPLVKGPGDWGWQGLPTSTGGASTPQVLAQRKNYWSLLGVVLGPPPFATNEMEAFEITDFSNVEYGSDFSSAIEHKHTSSNTAMVSSKTEVKAGFGSVSLEATYKHGWESSRSAEDTKKVGLKFTAGTDNESGGNFGTHGWAFFSTPTFLTQTYGLYAYDYDVATMTGTDLNLRLPTIVQAQAPTPESDPPLTINGYYFSLTNPGGEDDHPDIRGLLEGMPAYPNSTDLEAWHEMDWEVADAPYEVVYGTGTFGDAPMVSTVSQGDGADISFTKTTKNIESKGQTNSVDIQVGTSFETGSALPFGLSETLTVGYAGEWKVETTNTTELSSSVVIRYHMPFMPSECEPGDCVKSLVIQPYLLRATDYTAPWIPPKYGLNLPWAITWRVNTAEFKDGRKIGIAAPPQSIDATVIGGDGGGPLALAYAAPGPLATVRHHLSSYSLDSGRMSWLQDNGTEEPIPIGADGFDPQLGVVVRLNGYELATSGDLGAWKRKGEVWEYQTNRNVLADAFKLTLDFGKDHWHLKASGLELADVIRAGDRNVRVELLVNSRYIFSCNIEHKAKVNWKHAEQPPADGRMHMTSFEGSFDTETGDGTVLLKGVLPSELPDFGDVTLVVNGHERQVPLLVLDQFRNAFESGQVLVIQRTGLNAILDFGNKTWSASIDRSAFHPRFAPLRGGARVKVLVGGEERASREFKIPSFSTNLTFKR